MFWGLILKSNKKYTQTLEKSFHLSAASLDHSSSENEPVQVMYTHEDNSYLLCTLQKGKVYQVPLDLNFQQGDKLCFSTKGNGIVHLTGFLMEDDEFDDFDPMAEDESEDEEEIQDLRQKLKDGKKKQKPTKEAAKEVAGKKKQPVAKEVEEDDDDDEDSDELDETIEQDSGEGEEDSDEEADDDEEDDDDEEEEDSDDEAPAAPPAKQAKLDPKAQQNGKKQKNGLENGAVKPQEKQKENKESGEGKIQKLQGGLLIQDLKAGNGAEAKPGKKIQVYYEGRLKTNNKVFDSTKSGPGFKLTLGRGEVIKGWDIGLNGMKVGGKRRIVIPPALAYGAKGSPPVIPQNATLVFDVELKNVL